MFIDLYTYSGINLNLYFGMNSDQNKIGEIIKPQYLVNVITHTSNNLVPFFVEIFEFMFNKKENM